MKITQDTFKACIACFENCYKGFELSDAEISMWYKLFSINLPDEILLQNTLEYCSTCSAPTCPSDFINFCHKQVKDPDKDATHVCYEMVKFALKTFGSYEIDVPDDTSWDKRNSKEMLISEHIKSTYGPEVAQYQPVLFTFMAFKDPIRDQYLKNQGGEYNDYGIKEFDSFLMTDIKKYYTSEAKKAIKHLFTASVSINLEPSKQTLLLGS